MKWGNICLFCLLALLRASIDGSAADASLKVFLLVGQSNMEGHGYVPAEPNRNGGRGSLEFLTKDTATAEKFKHLLGPEDQWIVRDDVWCHFLDHRKGRLTVGFGANNKMIGPELGFGIVVGDALAEPVLLLKLAWGGKNLARDFRPPSAGGEVGPFYRETVLRVKAILNDLKNEIPELAHHTPELVGIAWHQGWNDRINQAFVDEYEANLAHLIRDLRRDLGVPNLPFVIAETGMGGRQEKNARALKLMQAQAAVAEHDEFKDNVAFVPTRDFWRDSKVSPSEQGYHWNSNAETYYLIGEAMGQAMLKLLARQNSPLARQGVNPPQKAEMAGYLLVPHERVDAQYNAGFSMYVAAWPLLKNYPGQKFQSGLFGTWMFAQYEGGVKPEKIYSDIEGGLGWWRDTRFATETPKFIMGGVALNFSEWANGPGAGKGRDWTNPKGHYAIAQLSHRVLWPPDGLNLKQGTNGELFGYGYLPLPLTSAKTKTAGKDIPTGNQCWTLFLNTGNFKGPVTFFLPYFWSKPVLDQPDLAGMFLDRRPSDPNKAVQMETQYIPAYIGKDANGNVYARVAPTQFPGSPNADAPLIHRITAYQREALWSSVEAWFKGGKPATGLIDSKASTVHRFLGGGGATWQIYPEGARRNQRIPIDWRSLAEPIAINDTTYSYKWNDKFATKQVDRVILPEYYRQEKKKQERPHWVPVSASEVPIETGLFAVEFPKRRGEDRRPYVTPEEPDSCWKKPGPVAGPFRSKLGDGSVLTYYWYRFADQPALLNADLSDAEREALQRRVELLHQQWTTDRDYLPPPGVGQLADLDPGVLVTPPKGLEIGFVPIVTRQEADD